MTASTRARNRLLRASLAQLAILVPLLAWWTFHGAWLAAAMLAPALVYSVVAPSIDRAPGRGS